MKLLSWNIQQGGGRRLARIEAAVRGHDPDTMVLGEYHPGRSDPLLAKLADVWPFQVLTEPPALYGGLALLSRIELEPVALPERLFTFSHRVLPVQVPTAGLMVIGLYGPLHKDPFDEYWHGLLDFLSECQGSPTVVVGDFNTGAPLLDGPDGTFFCSEYFGRLPEAGYRDLWRIEHGNDRREHTWFGQMSPFRLDHAFGSGGLGGRVISCRYDHNVRETKVSDHSAMIVEIAKGADEAT